MILILLLALSAFSLAGAAGYFSVVGLATTYAGSFMAVIALGSTIEFGKLVAVSFLYRFWAKIGWLFRSLLIAMITLVMIITSFGIFGMLSKANQTDMIGLKQSTAQITLLAEEESQLKARKLQIDQQIAQIKPDDINGRIRLNRQFKDELKDLNTRLPVISKEKSELAKSQIHQQAEIGPLVFIASALGFEVDVATTWFTLMLVAAFDPLAMILTICANVAIAHRQRDKIEAAIEEKKLKLTLDHVGDEYLPQAPPTFVAPTTLFGADTPHDPQPTVELQQLPVNGSMRVNDDNAQVEIFNDGAWHPYTLDSKYAAPEVIEEQPSAFPNMINALLASPVEEAPAEQSPASDPVVEAEPDVIEEAPVDTNLYVEGIQALTKDVNASRRNQPAQEEIAGTQFGVPQVAAWDGFREPKAIIPNHGNDVSLSVAQLRDYVAELDTKPELTDDEIALRSRIVAFIARQRTQQPI